MTAGMKFAAYRAQLEALYSNAGVDLTMRAPCNAEELRTIEREIGAALPAELRAAWLATDGIESNVFARPRFISGYEFLSTAEALKQRTGFRNRAPRYAGYEEPKPRDARIGAGWFQPGWLPFAGFGGATLLLIADFSPSSTGRAGQIIAFTHDPDHIAYVAPSFEEFLPLSCKVFEDHPDELIEES